ncbi:MAG: SMC-Scp complex subunit ScpB [Elusimicrobiota bacterium]|jgi:segregation and condensation protein B
MERPDIQKVIEALLFITEQPIPLKSLEAVFENQTPREELLSILQSITSDYAQRDSALEVREIAGGWQMATRPEFAPWIRKLFKDRLTYRLSNSALETLSIVAYKQPITRSEIEEIRGVEVTAVLDTLTERKLVRIAGRRESIGRPLLYGTTPDFLKAFGLKRLEDLPSIESLVPPVSEPSAEAPVPEGDAPQDPPETAEPIPASVDITN